MQKSKTWEFENVLFSGQEKAQPYTFKIKTMKRKKKL
jgi:hypothetical protein